MELVRAGTVGRPHGLRGELRVVADASFSDLLADRAFWLVGFGTDSVLQRRVKTVRRQPTAGAGHTLVVLFEGLQSRDDAGLLRGAMVYLPEGEVRDRLDPSGVDGMDGFSVIDGQTGSLIGSVKEVIFMPAHAVLVVERPGKGDVLIPNVPAFVTEIDRDGARIFVDPIEGLLDE